jgi:Arc/MetJ-type ribon-helix-helix transcriptional regulator
MSSRSCGPLKRSTRTILIGALRRGGGQKSRPHGRVAFEGRPPTGQDPVMTVRLPKPLTERIDQHAKARGESRSEVMRRFLEDGLERESAPVKRPRKPRAISVENVIGGKERFQPHPVARRRVDPLTLLLRSLAAVMAGSPVTKE